MNKVYWWAITIIFLVALPVYFLGSIPDMTVIPYAVFDLRVITHSIQLYHPRDLIVIVLTIAAIVSALSAGRSAGGWKILKVLGLVLPIGYMEYVRLSEPPIHLVPRILGGFIIGAMMALLFSYVPNRLVEKWLKASPVFSTVLFVIADTIVLFLFLNGVVA